MLFIYTLFILRYTGPPLIPVLRLNGSPCLNIDYCIIVTSQFEMTVHADERKFGGYVLIMNLPVDANLSDTI